MLISLSHIPSWFPSTLSHTSIAQLIPQQQCSFVSYRWSPDRHSEGHITLSNLTLKSTNDCLKHHAIYSSMHTKLSQIPSAPCTFICKWMPGPHDPRSPWPLGVQLFQVSCLIITGRTSKDRCIYTISTVALILCGQSYGLVNPCHSCWAHMLPHLIKSHQESVKDHFLTSFMCCFRISPGG